MAKSAYDELHDEYLEDGGGKAGTRYERLMGLVLAVLNRGASVVHDIRLRGDTGVAHQIDVRLTRNDGPKRHVLIECKDFDVSGDTVGLSVVRDFWGVVDDVKPDESWVVSCIGFTPDATRYACGKGIKLAILRMFHDDDKKGRVEKVDGTICLYIPKDFQFYIEFKNEDEQCATASQLRRQTRFSRDSPISVILKERVKEQFIHYIERKLNTNSLAKITAGPQVANVLEPGLMIQYGDAEPLEPQIFQITYLLQESNQVVTISTSIAGQLARLLLTPVGEDTDYVIMDEQLKEFTIDRETGLVKPKT